MKKYVTAIISVLLVVLLAYFSSQFSIEEITSFINSTGVWAPIVYIFIQILGQIFAPLSTTALFVAGYIVFQKAAIFYSIVIWLVSSVTNFWIARKLGVKVLEFFLGKKGAVSVQNILGRLDNKSLILLRLSTFYINDIASYAFGLSKVSFKTYLGATIVSILPWAILMNYLIDSGGQDIMSVLVKVLLSMIPFAILNYIFLKRKDH